MAEEKKTLRFVTWNICGIKNKLWNVLPKLEKLEANVAFIQETRIGQNCCRGLERISGWKVFFTVYSNRTKGVAIMVREGVPFEYICHDEDYSGGYIVLFCRLYGELFTLVSVYNHQDDKNLLVRLKDYLCETFEGVLLVGGDFNTVMDINMDRRTTALNVEHAPLRQVLENFTSSLKLRDAWAQVHGIKDGFTRKQNQVSARIDMFFMQEEPIKHVYDMSVEDNEIADHNPLVLNLHVQQYTGNRVPKVALFLQLFTYNNKGTSRVEGKISGAEILSVIKSLCDLKNSGPENVGFFKKHSCEVTEILKITFNLMLETHHIPEAFKGDQSPLRVDQFIFMQILANRLNMFIAQPFKKIRKANTDRILTMAFESGPQNINWSFLMSSLKKLKKKGLHSAPPPDFSVLDQLLPVVESSNDLRHLNPDCPLTNPILNLTLKELQEELKSKEAELSTSICNQRPALNIHAPSGKREAVYKLINEFTIKSGLKFFEVHNIE